LLTVNSDFCTRALVGLVAIAAVAFALIAGAGCAHAQADYRNLDPGRPIAVEDAQPIEYRAFETEDSIPRFSRQRRGQWLIALDSDFKWGIYKDLEFGYSGNTLLAAHNAGRTVVTTSDQQVHLLYNFNQETPRWPAVAIRPELDIRGGSLGARHEHGALKWIVTKTMGENRLHFNGSWTVGPTEMPGRGSELVSRYFYGAAYEHTLPLHFVVLLADVYARKPIDNSPTEVVLEVGTRVQMTPTWVVDAGVSTGKLRPSVGPDIGFTFGLSHSFSLRWLYPPKEKKK
jgi:hypothetical protein